MMINIIDNDSNSLQSLVEKKKNDLSVVKMDMSFGEIVSLYNDKTLHISPEYQRLFRWPLDKQSKFIESLLLGIPIPPIFVAEDKETGKWELIDGLQRVSTVISFMGEMQPDSFKLKTGNGEDEETIEIKNNWTLEEGGLVKEIEGWTFKQLPLKLQLAIKRYPCRVEVLKLGTVEGTTIDMRYELFNRLNTGGSPLKEQEIRNCIFRNPSMESFYECLKDLSVNTDFLNLVEPTKRQKSEMYTQELVLRFFAFYNGHENISDNLGIFLTNYMESIYKGKIQFKEEQKQIFMDTLKIINGVNSESNKVFRNDRNNFVPSFYDAIVVGISLNLNKYRNLEDSEIISRINELKNHEEFKSLMDSSSGSASKMKKRINIAKNIFKL